MPPMTPEFLSKITGFSQQEIVDKYAEAWEDAARWRWLFSENGANIRVSVKLRERSDGDMHDDDTKKFGILTIGLGVFPTEYFRVVVDALRLGSNLQKSCDLAHHKVVEKKT